MPLSLRHLLACTVYLTAISGSACATPNQHEFVAVNQAQASDLQPQHDTSEGEQLTQQYCTQCHALPSPEQHSAQQWPYVVNRMERYMRNRGVAMPDDNDTSAILDYLGSDSE